VTTFDELVGTEPAGAERERLRGVHELLLEAGPPPELTPEMEAGPTLAMTLSRAQAFSHRRRGLILTATAAALVALVIGLAVGGRGHGNQYPSVTMHGTGFAPNATGRIEFLRATSSRPRLKLEANGLPPLKKPYVVYLVRNGAPIAKCGSFTVSSTNHKVTAVLVSPYALKGSDKWIVTGPRLGAKPGPGPTVMQST